VGQQANLSKQDRWWIPELASGTEGAFKTELPHFAEGRADQTAAAEEQHSWCLVKITALTTLHELAVLPHLTIPTNLVDRRNKTLLTNQSPSENT
jgi:hypothetical protein